MAVKAFFTFHTHYICTYNSGEHTYDLHRYNIHRRNVDDVEKTINSELRKASRHWSQSNLPRCVVRRLVLLPSVQPLACPFIFLVLFVLTSCSSILDVFHFLLHETSRPRRCRPCVPFRRKVSLWTLPYRSSRCLLLGSRPPASRTGSHWRIYDVRGCVRDASPLARRCRADAGFEIESFSKTLNV